MKPLKGLCLAFTAALLLGAAVSARAADPLKIIPKEAEAIIGINVKLIANSDFFKQLTEQHPELNAQLQVVQNLTGINIPQDAERVVAFGRLSKKEFGGMVFVAKFDKEKMLTLLKANPRFQEKTVDGLTVYEWYEAKKKEMRYGTILDSDTAVICNSRPTAEACLAAIKDSANSFAASPDAQRIPQNAAQSAAWALAINRSDRGPAAKYKIAALFGSLTLNGADVTLQAGLMPQNAADAPRWVDVGKGLIAMAQLQPDKPELHEIAAGAQAAATPDGKAATLTIAVDQGKVLKAIGKKKPAAK